MYSTGGPGISQAEPKGKGQPAKGSAVCRGAAEGKTGPSVQITEEETGQQVAPTSPVALIGSYCTMPRGRGQLGKADGGGHLGSGGQGPVSQQGVESRAGIPAANSSAAWVLLQSPPQVLVRSGSALPRHCAPAKHGPLVSGLCR